MKKLNVKAALVLSLLAFSACDKGGKGSSTPQVVGVPGVTQRQYSVYPNQTCNINGDNTYTCTESGRTLGNIGFTSLESFCNSIMNDQANGFVARATRQQMYQEQCSGAQNNGFCGVGAVMQNGVCVNNNGSFPGTINPGTGTIINNANMKSVNCRLVVETADGSNGDTGDMNVQVIENSASGVSIFAFTHRHVEKKFLGFINFNSHKVASSEKEAKVKMYYKKQAGKADMITLEAKDIHGDLKTSVTGYAGSEVALEIKAEGGYSTGLKISCMAQGATEVAKAYKKYRCSGTEKIGSKTTAIKYSDEYTDGLMDREYYPTPSLMLNTAGSLATGEGSVSFNQSLKNESSVSTKSNITTPSAVKINRAGYSLDVTCEPIL